MRKSNQLNPEKPKKRKYSILSTTQISPTDDLNDNINKYSPYESPVKTTSSDILEKSFELSDIENKENVISEGNDKKNCVLLDFTLESDQNDSPKRKRIRDKSFLSLTSNNDSLKDKCLESCRDPSINIEHDNKNLTHVNLNSPFYGSLSGSKAVTSKDGQQAYYKSTDNSQSEVLHYSIINSEVFEKDSFHSTEEVDTSIVNQNLNSHLKNTFLNEDRSTSFHVTGDTYNSLRESSLVDTSTNPLILSNDELLTNNFSKEVVNISSCPFECSKTSIKDLSYEANDNNSDSNKNYSFRSEKYNEKSLKEYSKEEPNFIDLFPKENKSAELQRVGGTSLSKDLSSTTDYESLNNTEIDLFFHPNEFSNKRSVKEKSSFMGFLDKSNKPVSQADCGARGSMSSIFNSHKLHENKTLKNSGDFTKYINWSGECSNSSYNSSSSSGSDNDGNECPNTRLNMNTSHFSSDLSDTTCGDDYQQEIPPTPDSFANLENTMHEEKNDLDTSFFGSKKVPVFETSDKPGILMNALSSEDKYSMDHKNLRANTDFSIVSFSEVDNNFRSQRMATKDWNVSKGDNKPLTTTKDVSRISKQVSFNLNHEYIHAQDYSFLLDVSDEQVRDSSFDIAPVNQQREGNLKNCKFKTEEFRNFPQIANNTLDISEDSFYLNYNNDMSKERVSFADPSFEIEYPRNSKSHLSNSAFAGVSFELANLENDKFILNDSEVVGEKFSKDMNTSTVLDHSMIHSKKPQPVIVQRFNATPRSINQYMTPKNILRTVDSHYSVTKQSKLTELIASTPSMLKFSSNLPLNFDPSSVILKNRYYSLPVPPTDTKVSFIDSLNDKCLALVDVIKAKESLLKNKVLSDLDANALASPIDVKNLSLMHPEISRLFIQHIGNPRLKCMTENIASLKTLIDKYGDKINRINKMKTGILSKCIFCSNQRLCVHHNHLHSLQHNVTNEVIKDYKLIMEMARRKYNQINSEGEIRMNQELVEATNAIKKIVLKGENEKIVHSHDCEMELEKNQLRESEQVFHSYETLKSLKKEKEQYIITEKSENDRCLKFTIDYYVNPLRERIRSSSKTDFLLMGSRLVITANIRTDNNDQYLESATVTAKKTLQPMTTNIEQYFQNLINNNLINQTISIVKKSLLNSQIPILLLFNDFSLCCKIKYIIPYWKPGEPFKLKVQIATVTRYPMRFSVHIDMNPIETYQHRVLDYDIEVDYDNVDVPKVREILDGTPNGPVKLYSMFTNLIKSLSYVLINN